MLFEQTDLRIEGQIIVRVVSFAPAGGGGETTVV